MQLHLITFCPSAQLAWHILKLGSTRTALAETHQPTHRNLSLTHGNDLRSLYVRSSFFPFRTEIHEKCRMKNDQHIGNGGRSPPKYY